MNSILNKSEISNFLLEKFGSYEKPQPSERMKELEVVNEGTLRAAGLYDQWEKRGSLHKNDNMKEWYDAWYSSYCYEDSSDTLLGNEIDAGKMEPLKKYYEDKSSESILGLKGLMVTPFYGFFERYNKRTIKIIFHSLIPGSACYDEAAEMQRIINTPDELFREVLDNSEILEKAANAAPTSEELLYKDPLLLWHYRSIEFKEGGKYLEEYKKTLQRYQTALIEKIKNSEKGKLHLSMLRNDADDIGEIDYLLDYLEKNGLNNMTELGKNSIKNIIETENGYEMRFFVFVNRDDVLTPERLNEWPELSAEKSIGTYKNLLTLYTSGINITGHKSLKPIIAKNINRKARTRRKFY